MVEKKVLKHIRQTLKSNQAAQCPRILFSPIWRTSPRRLDSTSLRTRFKGRTGWCIPIKYNSKVPRKVFRFSLFCKTESIVFEIQVWIIHVLSIQLSIKLSPGLVSHNSLNHTKRWEKDWLVNLHISLNVRGEGRTQNNQFFEFFGKREILYHHHITPIPPIVNILHPLSYERTLSFKGALSSESVHLLNRQICETSESLAEKFIKLVTAARIQTSAQPLSGWNFQHPTFSFMIFMAEIPRVTYWN